MRPDELYHWGILGMKWGVRRFQNEDGSLTPEGRERYLKNEGNSRKGATSLQTYGRSNRPVESKQRLTDSGVKFIEKNIEKKYGSIEQGLMSRDIAKKSLQKMLDNKNLYNAINKDNERVGIKTDSPYSKRYIYAVVTQYFDILSCYLRDDCSNDAYASVYGMSTSEWNNYLDQIVSDIGGRKNAERALKDIDGFRIAHDTAIEELFEEALSDAGIDPSSVDQDQIKKQVLHDYSFKTAFYSPYKTLNIF